jgi:hypothetical protein
MNEDSYMFEVEWLGDGSPVQAEQVGVSILCFYKLGNGAGQEGGMWLEHEILCGGWERAQSLLTLGDTPAYAKYMCWAPP